MSPLATFSPDLPHSDDLIAVEVEIKALTARIAELLKVKHEMVLENKAFQVRRRGHFTTYDYAKQHDMTLVDAYRKLDAETRAGRVDQITAGEWCYIPQEISNG